MNFKNILVSISLCFFLFFSQAKITAETFRFKYEKGDTSRILSTVHEDVYVNNKFNHHSEIINRISVEITDTNSDENGLVSGVHHVLFMTSENASGTDIPQFEWGKQYESIFTRSPLGLYTIDDSYFMPVVRNVPIFPEGDIPVGSTWTAAGHEAYDLRETFNIEKPYFVPFTANYKYTGTIQTETGLLHVITVQYSLYYKSPSANNSQSTNSSNNLSDYPSETMGYSNQTIYWDNERGCINNYTENFRIVIETALGNTYEFRGQAGAEITDYTKADNSQSLENIRRQIQDMKIQNTNVEQSDNGITISIENIQFMPDSAVLIESEKSKLDSIAQILESFPDNDLLVTGHTALAGNANSRQKLSEERAKTVASYLTQLGVKDAYHIFTQGYGAEKPIADNTTEQGKAQNRRVEITILDK